MRYFHELHHKSVVQTQAYTYARVVKWQTRQLEGLVGIIARGGSSPLPSTRFFRDAASFPNARRHPETVFPRLTSACRALPRQAHHHIIHIAQNGVEIAASLRKIPCSNSNYGRQRVRIPAKAGTTNAFLHVFTVFVVPPLGGCVHN